MPNDVAEVVPSEKGDIVNGVQTDANPLGASNSTEPTSSGEPNPSADRKESSGLPADGNPAKAQPASVSWGGKITKDLRVKLEVPPSYLQNLGGGPKAGSGRPLQMLGGIVFPYTPQVTFTNQAVYTNSNPTHSNYANYFFKNSVSGPIKVTGKFTCQNEYEASVILGVQHLLRALTKMRWGDDSDAGAPPPVCRLHAFGNSMLSNVPVAVQSWAFEYPDNVDYIQVGPGIKDYGNSFVPTLCTISIDLVVMYSRSEMLKYNVDGFLNGKLSGKGYI